MEFRSYLIRLSDQLGEAQLPVNGAWRRATDIVRPDAVHYPLIKKIVADLYKRNRCSKPSDPVLIEAVLDYLGQLRFELESTPGHDLETIRLVEQIGEISVHLLAGEETGINLTAPAAEKDEPRSKRL